MVSISNCDRCEHMKKEKINGYLPICDAFPEGISLKQLRKKKEDLEVCNGSIGFKQGKV